LQLLPCPAQSGADGGRRQGEQFTQFGGIVALGIAKIEQRAVGFGQAHKQLVQLDAAQSGFAGKIQFLRAAQAGKKPFFTRRAAGFVAEEIVRGLIQPRTALGLRKSGEQFFVLQRAEKVSCARSCASASLWQRLKQ
jgi:hypothetical protein